MKVEIKFTINGNKEFIDRVARLIEKSPDKLDDAMDTTASDVERDAKQIVSGFSKTGELYRSIEKKKISKLNYIIGAYAGYAGWVERGHHSFPGKPFMEPSVRGNEPKLIAKINNGLKDTK